MIIQNKEARFEKDDIFHIGLDNLELYFIDDTCFNFEFEKNLNLEGSPEGETNIGTFHFKYTLGHSPSGFEKNYKFFLYHDYFDEDLQSFKTDFFNVFSIFYGDTNPDLLVKGRNKVVFHSTFFMYEEVFIGIQNKKYQFLYNFITKNFNFDFSRKHLHRFDIAVDVGNLKKSQIIPYFKNEEFSGHIGKLVKEPGFFETDYIKTKSSDKNRNYLIRIYDKISDTRAKKKWSLFGHLNKFDDVIRFEIEFRSDFCEIITKITQEGVVEDMENDLYLTIIALDLLNNPKDLLGKLFYSKIKKQTNLFNQVLGLNQVKFRPYEVKKSSLEKDYLKLGHIPEAYLKRFLGYSKTIINLTGYYGYFQAVLGLLIKDNNIKTTKIISDIAKNPENFIYEFLSYSIRKMRVDRYQLNKILKEFILPFKQK